MEGLSINNLITNEDIIITYTPSVINYSYVIIKDNVYGETIFVYDGTPSEIRLSDEGSYKVEVTENGIVTTGEYVIDKTAPIINKVEKTYTITSKEEFNVSDKVTATDSLDGNLNENITTNVDDLDFTSPGIKKLEYSVSDRAGNTATDTIYVTVKKDNSSLILAGQVSIILLVMVFILFVIKYLKSIYLEKRFSKYTINSSKNKSISLLDNLYNQYLDYINKMSKKLSKINFLNKLSDKYKKYVTAFELDVDSMKIVCNKIVIGILFILGYIVINLFRSKLIEPIEMLIPFILGFYTIDIIYIYKYKMYQKQIEKDLIDAITIMNNAFKAGRSIVQTVDLVSSELKGPISCEFKKISMEINLGLDIEVAFKRFADRIKLEEAVYLTSSLSILNKTGGNIIKVFDSIEKTLFNKKKLREELTSLTSSSKMIMYVLIFIPLVFAVFLNIINKGFFKPLFTTELGIILFIIMIILYITYIIVVRKVMKVRM